MRTCDPAGDTGEDPVSTGQGRQQCQGVPWNIEKCRSVLGGIKDTVTSRLLEYKPLSSTVPSNKRFVDKALLRCLKVFCDFLSPGWVCLHRGA